MHGMREGILECPWGYLLLKRLQAGRLQEEKIYFFFGFFLGFLTLTSFFLPL